LRKCHFYICLRSAFFYGDNHSSNILNANV
jgi:hypothetical protein